MTDESKFYVVFECMSAKISEFFRLCVFRRWIRGKDRKKVIYRNLKNSQERYRCKLVNEIMQTDKK